MALSNNFGLFYQMTFGEKSRIFIIGLRFGQQRNQNDWA